MRGLPERGVAVVCADFLGNSSRRRTERPLHERRCFGVGEGSGGTFSFSSSSSSVPCLNVEIDDARDARDALESYRVRPVKPPNAAESGGTSFLVLVEEFLRI